MKLIQIGSDRWINSDLVMAVAIRSTNVTVTMADGTEVIDGEVGIVNDSWLQKRALTLVDEINNAIRS